MRLVYDGFEIDQDGPRLVRGGREVPLERRTLDLLCYLAENPNRLLRKDELLERVWDAHTLSEGVLSNAIAKLRRALGQGARAREPIETVHGRGYRFHAVPRQSLPLSAAVIESPTVRTDPFVGRHAVMQLLSECLERAAGAVGQLILVTGEPGIGKSRTLEELAARARAAGFGVWRGAAYAGGAAPPYWPWIEVVRAASSDPTARKHIPDDSWALRTLVPESLGQARPLEDAHALRFRLFDELTRWFAAASAQLPRLVIIEDLHWADSATVDLLAHLVRGLDRQRVVLAVSARALDASERGGGGAQHAHEQAAQVQLVLRSATHVALHGLSPAEVAELVSALAASEPDAPAAERLYELTHGNPFFVRQVLQLLVQRGRPLAIEHLGTAELPAVVRDVIRQRLASLPAQTRALLATASAIGETFDAPVVASLLSLQLGAALSALEPALRAGLLTAHCEPLHEAAEAAHPAEAPRPHRFAFNHALVRESLYDELSLTVRGDLHLQLVRVLSDQLASPDARLLGEIARHSLLAVPCDLESCVRYCRRAADAAREASGFEAAADLLTRALEKLAVEGGPTDPPGEASAALRRAELRCELMYELSLDRFCAGELSRGWSILEAGVHFAAEAGAVRWSARFVCRMASWFDVSGSASTLEGLLDDALTRIDHADTGLRAALIARRAELAVDLDAGERRARYEEADRLAALGCAPEVLLDVASARLGQRDPSRLTECRDAIAAYRDLERRYPRALLGTQHRLRRFSVEMAEYWAALVVGDLAAADLAIAEAEVAVQTVRVPHLRCTLELFRATRALGDGRLDEATACIERMRSTSSLAGSLGLAWMFCSVLLAEAQDARAALELITGFADVSTLENLGPLQRAGALAWLAALSARAGNHALSRALLDRMSITDFASMPVRHGDLGLLCALAEASWELRDSTNADALYRQLAPYAHLNAVGIAFEYKGSIVHYLGMLSLLLGRPREAVAHLERAVTFNERLGMQLQLPQTRALLARAVAAL